MDRLSNAEFRNKLQSLKDDRGIVTRLRTQLRKMIIKELQSGPTALSYRTPVITVRGRALGSLVVEWLRVQECHFTLSVLASEVPSLSDLPGLAEDGEHAAIKEEEAEGILSALGLMNEEITKEYRQSTDCLLSCITKISSSWNNRLNFKEIPMSPRGGEKRWASRLRDVVANSCLDHSQMPAVYSALHNIISSEIEDGLAEERRALIARQAENEKKVRRELIKHEQLLLTRLNEAEQGLSESKEKANEEICAQRAALARLLQEVSQQHNAVADEIEELKKLENKLEASKRAWKTEVASERKRQNEIAEDLAKKVKALEEEKGKFLLEERVQKSILSSACKIPSGCPPVEHSSNPVLRDENSLPPKVTQEEKKTVTKMSPMTTIYKYADSSSSQKSSTKSSGVTSAAWRRLKELRDETAKNKGCLMELHKEFDDSDDSDSNENMPVPKPAFSNSQVTFPTLHEGCHYEEMAVERRLAKASRYRHLLSQGDQNIHRRTANQSRIPCIPEVNVNKKRDVRKELKEEADRLNNLIVSVRETPPSDQAKIRTVKEIRQHNKETKFDQFVHSIRSPRIEEQSDCPSTSTEKSYPPRDGGFPLDSNRSSEPPSENNNTNKKSRIPVSAGMSPRPEKRNINNKSDATFPITPLQRVESPRRKTPQSTSKLTRPSYSRENSNSPKVPSQLPLREITTPDITINVQAENSPRTSTSQPQVQPSLLQVALHSDSELSEGEVLSCGGPHKTEHDFWS